MRRRGNLGFSCNYSIVGYRRLLCGLVSIRAVALLDLRGCYRRLFSIANMVAPARVETPILL